MGIDYGREISFGVFPSPLAEPEAMKRVWGVIDAAERGGLDLVGIQDHPYQRRQLDTWSLMAAVLARTEQIRVFPDVANLPLRPPAVMAKAAASLDLISEGRFELGLGAGGFWEAIEAMGGPRRTPREAADALLEAIEVIRLMWSERRSVRFQGEHYQLSGVKPGPMPVHDIGIWLGVLGPRLLKAVGRVADGWVPSYAFAGPEKLPEMHGRIDEGAAEAGRDPATIRRVYNLWGTIGETQGSSDNPLDGPVDKWVEQITGFAVEYGMDTFVMGPAGESAQQVEIFAAEVVPAVREAVRNARA